MVELIFFAHGLYILNLFYIMLRYFRYFVENIFILFDLHLLYFIEIFTNYLIKNQTCIL